MSDVEVRTPPPGAVVLTSQILQAAITEDYDAASAGIGKLSDEYGEVGVFTLLYGVSDALVKAQGGCSGGIVRMSWVEEGSDEITGAEAPPPDVVWAGQFVAARGAMDHEMCQALLCAIPDDETFSSYVSALVHMVALSLRNADRLEDLMRRRNGGSNG